jgi:hypothetical protein
MKNYSQHEVILFPNYSFMRLQRQKLLEWLRTKALHAIDRQNEAVEKFYLLNLTDSPAIYLS